MHAYNYNTRSSKSENFILKILDLIYTYRFKERIFKKGDI
jgi:hypothetical protein